VPSGLLSSTTTSWRASWLVLGGVLELGDLGEEEEEDGEVLGLVVDGEHD
jgi:hypothetical protein